ncbi:MAG: sarcosine oxidase subunit gamma [Rhodobacteraceae bacterium]|nr:sarcosine oxidase subunit gamma [Paracoccaceae bacterium]
MSETISALDHARFTGFAKVEECGLQGMITLRGDLTSKPLIAGARAAGGGAKMPKMRMANVMDDGAGKSGLCWMSPDELLVLCPYDKVEARLTALSTKLGAAHALAVNVSDARAVFRVSGGAANAREVLAKLCPVDMSPGGFKPGMFRRTRMAQVAAAFWMDDNQDIYIICFRSVARYVFDLLKTAAQPGSKVDVF